MELIRLAAGDGEFVLVPEIGGSILSWTQRGIPMLRPALPGALDMGLVRGLAGYPLVPFSNRIAHGVFHFGGKRYALPAISGGHAIHGVGWKRPWTVISVTATAAILGLDHAPDELWPFAFHAEQRFVLGETGLTWGLRLTNRHDGPAPGGLGFHPYMPRHDGALLRFDAGGVWFNGADILPIREAKLPAEWDHRAGRRVGSTIIDNCFTGWRAPAEVRYATHTLTMRADALFRFFIAFTPEDKDFFAIEPVSHMNDGLNRMDGQTDHGVAVLQSGDTMGGEMHMEVTAA